MNRLQQLFDEGGQSPWLDNLKRGYLTSGQLQRLVADGIRGLTSNPTIFQKAIAGSADYDDQFSELAREHRAVSDSYWSMVQRDIEGACDVLVPLHEASQGRDGYVSVEVPPDVARDTAATIDWARSLDDRIDRPNVMIKIPGTQEGLPAIQQMIAEGRDVNVTLIFGLDRYSEVIDAYLAGLEERTGDLSGIASVASFFISRVDTEVDRRLDALGSPAALELRGKAAVAQAKLAYELFGQRFSGERWEALAARGARVQRPLWASTSTKNPAYRDTSYVDELIGPDTVNTLPDATVEAFLDHGTVARTIDRGLDEARDVVARLGEVGVDLDDVSRVLEEEGVSAFAKSFDELLGALEAKQADLAAG